MSSNEEQAINEIRETAVKALRDFTNHYENQNLTGLKKLQFSAIKAHVEAINDHCNHPTATATEKLESCAQMIAQVKMTPDYNSGSYAPGNSRSSSFFRTHNPFSSSSAPYSLMKKIEKTLEKNNIDIPEPLVFRNG